MDESNESNDEENGSSSSESDEEQDTVTTPPIKKPTEKGKKVVESTIIKTPHDSQHAPSTSTSPPAMHSQIMVPSASDVERSDSRGDLGGFTPDSPMDLTQHVEELIKGSASGLVVRLSNLKKDRNASGVESHTNSAIKLIVMNELGMPVGSGSEDSDCPEKIKSTTEKEHVLHTIHERYPP
jgi:hypothetical protein